jgi:ectoine hydroxylase-related dioxygenase (phytanoyl-CoA dioxygenase family)
MPAVIAPSLTEGRLSLYARDGYVLVPGAVPDALVAALCDATARVARKWGAQVPADSRDWTAPDLHEGLLELRQRDPVAFGAMYDTVQTSVCLQAIFAAPSVVDAAASALGEAATGLTSTGHMLRMDVPRDSRNALTWHQDSAHYPQNRSGAHGLVALVPLVDVGPHNGMIVVLPGSHRDGRVDHANPDKDGYSGSLQFDISQEVIDRYDAVTLEASAGDLVLCHMDLVHRSGTNESQGIRFVSGARYHRALTDDFVPGRLIYHPNEQLG